MSERTERIFETEIVDKQDNTVKLEIREQEDYKNRFHFLFIYNGREFIAQSFVTRMSAQIMADYLKLLTKGYEEPSNPKGDEKKRERAPVDSEPKAAKKEAKPSAINLCEMDICEPEKEPKAKNVKKKVKKTSKLKVKGA